MSIWLYILIILCIVTALLILRIVLMERAIKDILEQLRQKLRLDTNTIITVNTNNKVIKEFTDTINSELKELRKQRLQYENGNQGLKKSITNISHDLRTPLTAISGYADLLKDENLTEKQAEYVRIINGKTDELIGLTEQLFDFSRSFELEKKLNIELCCLNDVLEEIVASYYKIFKGSGIIPNIKLCKEKINKYIDRNMLVRIFENLISNAIKYSDCDCNIELQENGKIIFSNKTSKLNVVTVKKIFDRYYTVENGNKNTGVGLSIAKQLVELNNGTIVAKYTKNMFYIEIEFD